MMSRSFASHGLLMIRAGRIFSTMPGSANQTSPRFGKSRLPVQHLESDAGALRDVLGGRLFAVKLRESWLRQRAEALPQSAPEGVLLADRQGSNFVQNGLGFCLCVFCAFLRQSFRFCRPPKHWRVVDW